jgi:hypothetical protein
MNISFYILILISSCVYANSPCWNGHWIHTPKIKQKYINVTDIISNSYILLENENECINKFSYDPIVLNHNNFTIYIVSKYNHPFYYMLSIEDEIINKSKEIIPTKNSFFHVWKFTKYDNVYTSKVYLPENKNYEIILYLNDRPFYITENGLEVKRFHLKIYNSLLNYIYDIIHQFYKKLILAPFVKNN